MSALVRLPALFGASRRAWIRVGLATLALGMTGAFNATVSLAADDKAGASGATKDDGLGEMPQDRHGVNARLLDRLAAKDSPENHFHLVEASNHVFRQLIELVFHPYLIIC